eukprot:GABV01008610.1.p4 GENE.GABV01008610.1~~GABV01008610.1.p4  ORF type:complete len:107 (-),score=31.89 GABV01008610.1:630-950(-)
MARRMRARHGPPVDVVEGRAGRVPEPEFQILGVRKEFKFANGVVRYLVAEQLDRLRRDRWLTKSQLLACVGADRCKQILNVALDFSRLAVFSLFDCEHLPRFCHDV